MEFLDGQWDLEVVGDYGCWFPAYCFPLQGTDIWIKYFVGDGYFFNSDRAVLKKAIEYNCLEFMTLWADNHIINPPYLILPFILACGEVLLVFLHHIH